MGSAEMGSESNFANAFLGNWTLTPIWRRQLDSYGVHLLKRVEADHFPTPRFHAALDFLRREGSLAG
jgi:hypothetical protein